MYSNVFFEVDRGPSHFIRSVHWDFDFINLIFIGENLRLKTKDISRNFPQADVKRIEKYNKQKEYREARMNN